MATDQRLVLAPVWQCQRVGAGFVELVPVLIPPVCARARVCVCAGWVGVGGAAVKVRGGRAMQHKMVQNKHVGIEGAAPITCAARACALGRCCVHGHARTCGGSAGQQLTHHTRHAMCLGSTIHPHNCTCPLSSTRVHTPAALQATNQQQQQQQHATAALATTAPPPWVWVRTRTCSSSCRCQAQIAQHKRPAAGQAGPGAPSGSG
jgi:hypothetical protein